MKEIISDELLEALGKDFILSTIDDVMTGNADEGAIRHFIFEAAYKIHHNQPLPEKLKLCLVHALSRIAMGDDPAEAFLLKYGSKRKSDFGLERTIALRVWVGIKRDGLQSKDSINQTACFLNKTPDAITKIYYRHKKKIETKFEAVVKKSNLLEQR
jgi:hypothetical protein